MLAAVPDGCRTALDADCGDGLLARKPAERSASVTGVDRSAAMIELARGYARVPSSVTFLRPTTSTSWCGTDREKAAPELPQEPPSPHEHATTRRRSSASPAPATGS
ncbi:methyltransferase domain-containing protein [Streptomyces massasporeus]|uniref:methyltransferase domain-containing protein n=1 Tax=Streptomyces massasporeus TaxID=67324 RepID=UPI0037163F07